MNSSGFVFDPLEVEIMLERESKMEQEYLEKLDEEHQHFMNQIHFESAMVAAGIKLPKEIIADNKVHFFSPGKTDCDGQRWYILFDYRFSMGAFGNLQTGVGEIWSVPNKVTTK